MPPRKTCRLAVLSLALLTLPGTVLAQEPLAALIQSALASHPALRAQSGMRQAAQAGVEGAKWQYWPTPSLGVERANIDDPAYRGDKTATTLRLQQPLWTGGRLDGNLSKAEAQAVIAQADMEATRQQLALRVVQAWSEAEAAQGKQTAYRQSRDVHARLLALVERRSREGASAQADIDLARSRLDGTEADLATARAQYDTALDKLRLLTGRPLATGEVGDVADSERPNLDPELDKLLPAARERSPQIAKARAQEHVADADVAVAKAALSPEVYLRAERQYGNLSLPDQDPQNRVFIGLSTAFGSGLSSLSGVDAARARQRAAQEDIQTQQLSVDEQVRSDATVFRSAGERRLRLEQVRRSSAQVTASWERQFLAGRKQWQDLMNATREQTQNDIQLADTLASQQLTGWRLTILTRGVDAALERQARPAAVPAVAIPTKVGAGETAPVAAATRQPRDPATEIYAAIDTWLAAWQRRDAESYLAAYVDEYRKLPAADRQTWESGVRQRLQKLAGLQLKRGELELRLEGESQAIVRFRQTYRSSQWQDITHKTLVMTRVGEQWLIASETSEAIH